MDFLQIPFKDFEIFFLVLIRVSVLLFLFPFFNSRLTPVMVKAGMAFLISFALLPIIEKPTVQLGGDLFSLLRLIGAEFVLGLCLGMMVQLFLEAIRIMGQLIGFQAGFAVASMLDPQSGTQASILANIGYFVAITLFLVLNGHHILIGAVKDSFSVVPLGAISLSQPVYTKILKTAGDMFLIALKMGAPAVAALLFTQVVFGLVTKLIPQMNIMMVAFPIQTAVGLIFFGVCLSLLLPFMQRYLETLGPLLKHVMILVKA
jgi:flagellar biosynthesis protein FliR